MTWKSKMLPNHTYCLIRVLLIFQRKLYQFSSIFGGTPETFDFLPFTVLTSYLSSSKKIYINKKLFAINIKKANGTVYSSPTPYPKKRSAGKINNKHTNDHHPQPAVQAILSALQLAGVSSSSHSIAQHNLDPDKSNRATERGKIKRVPLKRS